MGTYVGDDCSGNKYYENDYYQFPRNRWVEYNIDVRWDMDASQITPEWFGWIHHKTDRLPCNDNPKLCIASCPAYTIWVTAHEENRSGTNKAFYPYSTTRPRIYTWDGCNIYVRCGTAP